MIDWTKSMQQTYEFYIVDPSTWKDSKRVDNIEGCKINRDPSNSTLGSATIDSDSVMDECYIRVYLIAIQNENTQKEPLATVLVQTPSTKFDGKKTDISMDAYTPLIELSAKLPPIGYALLKDEPIMDTASRLCRENLRAPVVMVKSDDKLKANFISNLNDTWLSFLTDLISNAKYKFSLDPLGRILFEPEQDIASLRPVWTYDDGNSSILYPDIIDERDLYNIPNVVEVVYSTDTGYMISRIVNNDENSPVSVVNRGREVVYRDTAPNFTGIPTQEYIDDYATRLLRNLSCLEHKVTYKHAYCPVKVGDCVMLDYKSSGITNVKAKVISQNIDCVSGCPVEETAVYTEKLWR